MRAKAVARLVAAVALMPWVMSCGILLDDGKYYLSSGIDDASTGGRLVDQSAGTNDSAAGEGSPGADHDDDSPERERDSTDRGDDRFDVGDVGNRGGSGSGGGGGGGSGGGSGRDATAVLNQDGAPDSSDARDANAGAALEASNDTGPTMVDGARGPVCSTESGLLGVSYYTQDTVLSTAAVQFDLSTVNNGALPVRLSDVTLRYWFSADGNNVSTLTFASYAAWNGPVEITSHVTGSFALVSPANNTSTSDTVLEIAFDAAAGNLAPARSGALTIVASFQTVDYRGIFDERNDYSFDGTKNPASGFQTSFLVSAYIAGRLVSGCEPARSRD